MPILLNPRYEAFAQARAKGARLDDAFEDAGFVLRRGHSSRLARRPEVAQRIAELRADRNEAESISPQRLIAALLRMAKAGEMSSYTDRVKEARLALLDAARLQAASGAARRQEQLEMIEQAAVEAAPETATDLPARAGRLPETCLGPARARQGAAARLPLDGPSPTARLPAPAASLPVSGPEVGPRLAPGPALRGERRAGLWV